MVDLNWADWMIFAILAISCVFGLKRGLIKEVLSIVNWVLALVIAISFKDQLALLMEDVISVASLREIAAFVILFLSTLVVGTLFRYIISAFINVSGISTIDRMFGLLFGFLRGCVVIMALLMLVPAAVSVDQDQWWADSFFIPNFLEYQDWARLVGAELQSWAGQS